MRDKELLEKRNKAINQYFNEQYTILQHGSPSARINVAIAKTAEKFYLSVRTVERVINGK